MFGALFKKIMGKARNDGASYQYDYDPNAQTYTQTAGPGMKKGGVVKSSASKRADGIAQRGKTKGRMV